MRKLLIILGILFIAAVVMNIKTRNAKLSPEIEAKMQKYKQTNSHTNPLAVAFPLVIVGLIVAPILFFRYRKNRKSKEQLKKQQGNPDNWLFMNNKGGSFAINPFRGLLVTGGAGSGKTESVAKQVMYNAVKRRFAGLVYDFKYPSLVLDLEGYRLAENSPILHYYVNFVDVNRSHRVNPLNPVYLPNSSYAREYATAIIDNLIKESIQKKDFWIRSATDLLTATIWYLRMNHPDKCTLPHVLAMIASKDTLLVKALMSDPECQGMIISIAGAMDRKADGQTAGVIGTLQSATAQINTPDIAYILSGNDFSLDVNDPADPKLVTIGNYPTLVDTFAPVVSLIITVATKWMNQQGKARSFILLDEAPTLSIPKLEMIPATARSNKVAVVFMAQDLSQIADQYGNTKSDVIISNLGNQLHGRTTNPKTAQHVSNLFGKADVTYNTESSGKHGTTNSQSIQQRERVKVQDMTGLSAGEFFGLVVRDDGTSKDFKDRFAMVQTNYNVRAMPQVNANAANEVRENFLRIRAEVNEILGIAGTAQPQEVKQAPKEEDIWS
jgi:type IV secretory pathway TraG/TraD family ATPase VirD4